MSLTVFYTPHAKDTLNITYQFIEHKFPLAGARVPRVH